MSTVLAETFFSEDTEKDDSIKVASNTVSTDEFFSGKEKSDVSSITQQGDSNVISAEDFF